MVQNLFDIADSNATEVYIASGVDQTESEQALHLLVDAIEFSSTFSSQSNPQECVDAFLPFMCQYLFPVCNISGDAISRGVSGHQHGHVSGRVGAVV